MLARHPVDMSSGRSDSEICSVVGEESRAGSKVARLLTRGVKPVAAVAWGRILQLVLLAASAWAATYSRVAIGPLQESMQRSLRFSDNEIALLQGMGLALPLAFSSVPLGLLADRASRLRMLLFFMTLALVSCVLSAFAWSFLSMLASRALAGLSVAGVSIAAYSMLGDLFRPSERGRASMVMAIAEVFGAPVAFALGGTLLVAVAGVHNAADVRWSLEDWRLSLLMMSAVLIPVMMLMCLVKEPARTERGTQRLLLRTVGAQLWRSRRIAVPLQLARATLFLADGAVFVWGAPLFAREYRLAPDQVGAMMGTVLLVGGLLGPMLGGMLTDYCQRRGGPRLAVTVSGIVSLLSVPAAFFALMPDADTAGFMLALFLTVGFATSAAGFALLIVVIPGEMRGLNLGISIVVGSLFFIGLAPLAVSGLATALGGEEMIAVALTSVCVTMSLITAAVLIFSRRHFAGQSLDPVS